MMITSVHTMIDTAPEHVDPIDGQAVRRALERLADRVQRARAEVAVDDPERPDDQRNQSRAWCMARLHRHRGSTSASSPVIADELPQTPPSHSTDVPQRQPAHKNGPQTCGAG